MKISCFLNTFPSNSTKNTAVFLRFSQTENITLEQYFILQKIEKVKELLIYRELTLSQIADKLGYKTVQHLSQQFKKTQDFRHHNFKNSKKKETSY
jgi:AraC-like DNA-binding protein